VRCELSEELAVEKAGHKKSLHSWNEEVLAFDRKLEQAKSELQKEINARERAWLLVIKSISDHDKDAIRWRENYDEQEKRIATTKADEQVRCAGIAEDYMIGLSWSGDEIRRLILQEVKP